MKNVVCGKVDNSRRGRTLLPARRWLVMALRPNRAVTLYFIINYLHTVSHKRSHPSSCPGTLFLLKDVRQPLKIDRREERNTWLD